MGGRGRVCTAAALAVLPPNACLTYYVNLLVSSARAQGRRMAARAGNRHVLTSEIKRHEKPRVLFSETKRQIYLTRSKIFDRIRVWKVTSQTDKITTMPQSITDAHDGFLSFSSLSLQLRLSPRRYQTDGLSFHVHNRVRLRLAATLSNIIDSLLFPSTLYRPITSRTRSSSLHLLSPSQAS